MTNIGSATVTCGRSKHFVVHLSHLSRWHCSCQDAGNASEAERHGAKEANLPLSLVVVVHALELNQSGV